MVSALTITDSANVFAGRNNIGKGTYSCKLIESTKEFIVNVPPKELKPLVKKALKEI